MYFDITRLSTYNSILNAQESNGQEIRKFKTDYFITTEFIHTKKKENHWQQQWLKYISLALDVLTNVSDTAQLLLLTQGVKFETNE